MTSVQQKPPNNASTISSGPASPSSGTAGRRRPLNPSSSRDREKGTTIQTQLESTQWQATPFENDAAKDSTQGSVGTQDTDTLLGEFNDDFDISDAPSFDTMQPKFQLQTPTSSSGQLEALQIELDGDFGIQTSKPVSRYGSFPPSPPALPPTTQISPERTSDESARSLFSSIDTSHCNNLTRQTQFPNHLVPNPGDCKCLETVVSLFWQLTSKNTDASLQQSLLGFKEYISKSYSVIGCKSCMSKADLVMLLTLVHERLVSLCEAMANTCLNSQIDLQGTRNEGLNYLGQYPITDPNEFSFLLRALTKYHVKVLGRQVLMMRTPASNLLCSEQMSILLTCENKLRELVTSLS